MNFRIGIAGNIGVGKSTLTELLAQHLGAIPYYEQFQGNPYLHDFYRDMHAWSFHSQIYFLIQRVKEIQELSSVTDPLVLDRTIYEDAEIFAKNLYLRHHLDRRDYETYYELYETVGKILRKPDLIVFLAADVPTLQRRIAHRGRLSEKGITPEYLEQLNHLYTAWSEKIPGLTNMLQIDTRQIEIKEHSILVQIFAGVDQALAHPTLAFQQDWLKYVPRQPAN